MTGKQGTSNRRQTAFWIAFGVLCGLAAAGLIILITSPRRGHAIQLAPASGSGPVLVHVSGAVEAPGVYELPLGSRARDAIEMAGGASEDADLNRINLARVLQDGQQIHVPIVGDDSGEAVQFPININIASVEQLSQLPGIGEVTAQAIIDYRESQGPFQRIEDIQNVSGIGPNTYENIRELISVEG